MATKKLVVAVGGPPHSGEFGVGSFVRCLSSSPSFFRVHFMNKVDSELRNNHRKAGEFKSVR